MRKRPRSIMPETSIAEAVSLMNFYQIDGLPVAVNKKLVGFVRLHDVLAMFFPDDTGTHKPASELDMRHRQIRNAPVARVAVKRLMGADRTSVASDQTVNAAMEFMLNAQVSRLPVIENGRLVGVISLDDMHKAIPGTTSTRVAA